jgi:diguanylate cyclase (GGDEF)-like protein
MLVLLISLSATIYLNLNTVSFILIITLLALISLDIFKSKKEALDKSNQNDSSQIYLDAFETSGIYAKLDSNKNILHANRQFCQILHVKKEESQNINFTTLIKSNSDEIFETIKHNQSWEGTQVFTTLNHYDIYLNCSFIPILDENEVVKEILFLATDFTELVMSKTSIKNNIYIDATTKLPNRLKLFTDDKVIKSKNKLTCIIFNIDSFDSINNLYGNKFGDNILFQVGQWLNSNVLSQNSKLYKLEADSYTMVGYEKMSEEKLAAYLKEISRKITSQKFLNNGAEIDISMTIGASQSFSNQLKLAQIAYSEAKKAKKSYLVYDKKSKKEEEYINNIQISKILKNAVENDLLVPYFQPIMNIQTNQIEKYESLMRIKDASGNILAPCEFLDLAKHSKIYPKLSRILIDKCINTFLPLSHEFSVNVSFLDITNPHTTKFILDLLDKTGIGPWIIFELLESEGIDNYKEVKQFIQDIKSYGAKIAIDDFGSGYSNFERIVELQVDYIKIDGSLIKNMSQNDDMLIMTRTITNFAKELGIQTVAEYVHSKEVLEQVRSLGIDFAQGFYIGKPEEKLLSPIRVAL